jgi:hypothetical protein
MNKYEKLIEYIINDNEQAARELFHQIVVEKSRDIYESLMDEEQVDEMGGNPAADFVNDVTAEVQADETDGLGEEEDAELDADMDMDMDMDDEEDMDMGMDDEAGEEGEGEIEDRVMDLEAELDALKAEFDKLVAGEESEEENYPGIHGDEMGDEMDDMGDEEEPMMEADEDDEDDEESEKVEEAKHSKKDDKKADKKDKKSDSEVMKEYVEKVKEFYKGDSGEGHEVGTGGSVNVNKKSITDNMKNDMGGTTANIVKGGAESDPSGQKPNGKAGGFMKPAQEIDVAKRNVNKPGGNKGAQNFYSTKAPGSKPEGSTTDGSMPVAKNSILKAR